MKKFTKALLLLLALVVVLPAIQQLQGTQAQAADNTLAKPVTSLAKPTIKKVKLTSKGNVKLTWKAVSGAKGYIIYRDGVKLKKIKNASTLSYTDKTASAGTHKYRIRAYSGSVKSKYSKTKSITVPAKSTDTAAEPDSSTEPETSGTTSGGTTDAAAGTTTTGTYDPSANSSPYAVNAQTVNATWAIEADLTISGSGTGYHGKFLVASATSAVSFGIQYDEACGQALYRSKKAFMFENVGSNDAGGQSYGWIGTAEAKQTYHIMIAYKNCVCTLYVDGVKVKTVTNSALTEPSGIMLEASCRKNGDSVKAVFSNVQAKIRGTFYPASRLGANAIISGSGMKASLSSLKSKGTLTLSGTLKLASSKDWDSAYNSVSAYAQMYAG